MAERKFPKAGAVDTRAVTIDRAAVDSDKRTVDLAFSSETPVARWWGIEVLSHKKGAVNLSRLRSGGAVLLNHSTDRQVGVVDKVSLDDDAVARATVRFSRSSLGEEVWQDVQDGIRKNVSVGYSIDEDPVQLKPEELSEELKDLSLKENAPVYLIKRWTPYEVSMVPIPADVNVGVGRAADEKAAVPEAAVKATPAAPAVELSAPAAVQEVRQMEENVNTIDVAAERAKAAAEARENEGKRRDEIWALSAKHGIPAFERDKALANGTTIEQFRGIVLNRIGPGKQLDTPAGEVGLTPKEVRQYSFLRAVRAAISKDWRGAEFEKECSNQIAKQVGSDPRSFFLPYDLLTAKRGAEGFVGLSQRDLNVGTDAQGGYLKGTSHMAGSFIELLRARLVAAQAGVGIMSGLVGNIDIPKQTGATTAYWVGEGNAPTEGAPTFGQVLLSPKSIGAYVDITRRLMQQSAPAADNIVMNDLVRVIALGIDKAVFHGAGTNEPLGIDGTSGIGTFTGTTFSRTLAVSALTDVMNANADKETMAWVCNPTSWGILKVREQGTAGYPIFLCGDDNRMLGYPVLTSTQITAANLFFGDFGQAIIGEWGVLDINVDDKSLSTSGGIRIVGFQSVDVGVRQAGAFTLATNLS